MSENNKPSYNVSITSKADKKDRIFIADLWPSTYGMSLSFRGPYQKRDGTKVDGIAKITLSYTDGRTVEFSTGKEGSHFVNVNEPFSKTANDNAIVDDGAYPF